MSRLLYTGPSLAEAAETHDRKTYEAALALVSDEHRETFREIAEKAMADAAKNAPDYPICGLRLLSYAFGHHIVDGEPSGPGRYDHFRPMSDRFIVGELMVRACEAVASGKAESASIFMARSAKSHERAVIEIVDQVSLFPERYDFWADAGEAA